MQHANLCQISVYSLIPVKKKKKEKKLESIKVRPFTIVSETMKYIEINLTKCAGDFCGENYNTYRETLTKT